VACIKNSDVMKKYLFIFALFASNSLFGQGRQPSPENPSLLCYPETSVRTEIILPEVNGYKVVKTDLHVHTVYSDGRMTPAYRVVEAWEDGLDAFAMTDHAEYRPNDKLMKQFLANGIEVKELPKEKIGVDFNFSSENAVEYAKNYGLTVIPGIEITRDPVTIGHFNALFTTDNNAIFDPDPLQAIRNAKKQGAIVQHNHPGWRKPDNEYTPVMKAAMKEGLIDGVEVFNSYEFYPDVIKRALKEDLYISSGSDIHFSSYQDYGHHGYFRDMTFVFAKDASLASIREAIEARRTLAYAYGDIAGSEDLLKDFFTASFEFKHITKNAKGVSSVQITNKSSLTYILLIPGYPVPVTVKGFSSIISKVSGAELAIEVRNMWCGTDEHPVVKVSLKN